VNEKSTVPQEIRIQCRRIDINYTEALALGQLAMNTFSSIRMACCCRCCSLRVCVWESD